MRMPFDSAFYIASPFGYRVDPITFESNVWHGGVDLVSDDTRIRAVVAGTVLQSRIVEDKNNRTWEWGNYVSVAGRDGKVTYYCHMETRAVEAGQYVQEGQLLGIEGSTGRSTGRHLHFELRDGAGNQLNPCAYIGIPNIKGFEYEPPKADDAHWWDEALAWGVENGITDGTNPDGQATRAMVITMLKRYHDRFF